MDRIEERNEDMMVGCTDEAVSMMDLCGVSDGHTWALVRRVTYRSMRVIIGVIDTAAHEAAAMSARIRAGSCDVLYFESCDVFALGTAAGRVMAVEVGVAMAAN